MEHHNAPPVHPSGPKKGMIISTLGGFVQLGLVAAFICGTFIVAEMLKINKRPPGEKAFENRILIADAERVTPSSYPLIFHTTGIVVARTEVSVVPQVSGRIVAVNDNFFPGGVIQAGEVLFEIEPRDYELAVARMEAEVVNMRAAYDLAKAEAKAAREGWRQINPKKAVPALVGRKPQLDQAQANLNAAEAALADARLDLERTKVSVPFTGRVLSASLENGQFVNAGQSYGTVYDLGGLEVRASLDDKELEWIAQSDNPEILIRARYLGRTREYQGMLKRSVSSLERQTRFASVNIGFATPPEDLVPGLFVDLEMRGPKLEFVHVLPVTAQQKGGTFWGVNADNSIYELGGEVVFSDDQNTVLEGLDKPVRVVTSNLPGAAEGMYIKLTDEKESNEQ